MSFKIDDVLVLFQELHLLCSSIWSIYFCLLLMCQGNAQPRDDFMTVLFS